jgi:hypothetical protein
MAKRIATKTEASAAAPKTRSRRKSQPPISSAPRRAASHEDIARRAFELYQSRGADDGHDMHDWLRAESELAARAS